MAVPTEVTYTVAVIEAANTALLGEIDAGTGAGYVDILDSADTVLATVTLSDPAGTVSGVTGELTLSFAGPDTSPAANGVAAYADIRDSDDTLIMQLPAVQGTDPVSGYLVMPNLSVVTTGEVEILSGVIG